MLEQIRTMQAELMERLDALRRQALQVEGQIAALDAVAGMCHEAPPSAQTQPAEAPLTRRPPLNHVAAPVLAVPAAPDPEAPPTAEEIAEWRRHKAQLEFEERRRAEMEAEARGAPQPLVGAVTGIVSAWGGEPIKALKETRR